MVPYQKLNSYLIFTLKGKVSVQLSYSNTRRVVSKLLLCCRRENQECLAFMNSSAYFRDCCWIFRPFGPRQQKIRVPINLCTKLDIYCFKCTHALMLPEANDGTKRGFNVCTTVKFCVFVLRNVIKFFKQAVHLTLPLTGTPWECSPRC